MFKEELGHVTGFPAELTLKEGAQKEMRIFKAHTPPYNMRELLKETLQKMEREGVLERVDSSPIVSPIRAVVKTDGSLRVCGNYKKSLNPLLDTKQYPLPTTEECFHPMRGGEKYSKIDIRAAYNNIELCEKDQYLTTIATPQGLYKWKRLPYGVSSATAIFQQVMDQVLQGVEKCVCRVDDILITGSNDQEHCDRLGEVLDRLYQAGFRCRLDKSKFLADEVIYLGHRISKEGVTPCSEKVKTLLDAPYPENLEQLIAFLGAVNYYGRYIKNMASVIDPLNQLRAKDAVWKFGKIEKKAFNELKNLIASSAVLVQYNPDLPLKIDTDASKGGIGAVISHITEDGERPIEFASRSLTKAERKYSQIEKEALAIIWGVKKFHRYIYAREFRLVTDHKPLTFIFGEKRDIPEMGVSRIQRWAILLASYRYKIEYRSTKLHSNADMCSRFPLKIEADDGDEALQEDVFACEETAEVFRTTFEEKELINHVLVSHYSRTDATVSKVIKEVQEGWSGQGKLPGEYYNRRTELSVEHNCLLWGARVVIPSKLRESVLNLLHATHLGIVNMKALARSYFWWPGITKDIENLAKNCEVCKLNQKNPPKTVLHPWIASKAPWERIHIDFCTYNNDQWLLASRCRFVNGWKLYT